MTALLAWFATSRIGRYLAAAAALAFVVGVALLEVFGAGKAAERAKETKARLQAVAQRRKSDAAIDALGPADLDRRADRWVQRD